MNADKHVSAGREISRAVLLLVVLWVVQLLLLTGAALIPREAIRPNMERAAAYYQDTDDFQILWEPDQPGLVHNYADALLLNIIWNQDSDAPLDSVLRGAYYRQDTPPLTQGEALADTVAGAEANTEYARYWHGMTIFLKPLLCFLTMGQIKLVGALVLALLAGTCLVLLFRRGQRVAAVSLGLGLIFCRSWIVPMCVEYYACFALAFAGADWVLLNRGRMKRPWLLFVVMGALVCYFDFLTCEILTLGIPLMVLLLLDRKDRRASLQTAALCAGVWLASYALTWLCKWGISVLVLGQSLGDIALNQGIYRVTGELGAGVDYGFQSVAAIVVNLSMLQPFQALQTAPRIQIAFCILAVILFSLWFLFRRTDGTGPALALFLLSLLPFVRFFFISNHAALHPFFTYRSLLLTMAALPCAMALSMARPGTEHTKGTPRKRRKP